MAGRRYTRDNRGRFATVGATARGGRLATASGNKRATQTAKIGGGSPKGTVGKPKGLKPQSAKSLRTGVAVNRMRSINQEIGKGPDLAQVNVKGRFRGQAGKRMDAEITRNVKAQKASARSADKARNSQFKSEQSRAKALRTAHVGSIAKAKGLTKGQVESALKAQSPSVQIKALKNWVRDNRKTAAPAKGRNQTTAAQQRQARATANFTRAAAAKPLPGNRRLTKPQVRSQLRTESAMRIYKGGEAGAKEIRNARGLARTSKAKNNQLQTRAQRLANAQRSGNPLVTVSGLVKRRTGNTKPAAGSRPSPARSISTRSSP